MILDSFTLHKTIFQFDYADSFLLWDRSGVIAKRLTEIWPNTKVKEGQPHLQVLSGDGAEVHNGFSKSSVTLSGDKQLGTRRIQQVKDTFEVWREMLELKTLTRVSTRAIYVKHFDSIKDANAAIFDLNLAKWPSTKVFDQTQEADLNGLEIAYRFEDKQSFTIVRVKAEQLIYKVELDPYYLEEPELESTKSRMVIDFDRGMLGTINAENFRIDEWVKGFQHLLNRDIEKVLKG